MYEHAMSTTSGVAAATSFVASANDWLQFVALGVAIISGGLSIYSFFTKRRNSESKTSDSSRRK